ncbi:MAG: GNAT family N-acetyltransferase [Acidobacteria bacterium]|nr:GNAT family N-acetyltransferase [Acidobacteriota bacterium]
MDSEGAKVPPVDERAVTLRPVMGEDDEFLLAVYASSREDELAQVQWPEGLKETFLRMQFDAQRAEYEQRHADAEYAVVLVDRRPAGRIWIARPGDEIHLLDIALLPEFQNSGVGTVLLRRLMDEARRAALPLRHYVFVLNTEALRFYERLGFSVIGESGGAYRYMEWLPPGTEAAAAPPPTS